MNNYSSKSRLKRKLEKQTKKQIFFSTIGIIILLFLIFKYGITATTEVGKVIIKFNEIRSTSKSVQDTNNNYVILPPHLDPIIQATKSASINITGNSIDKNGKILLYLNSNLKAEMSVDKDGKFKFKNIELEEGDNFIKTQFKNENGKISEFSAEYDVIYKKRVPALDINFPTDGASFSKYDQNINMQGKTDPDNSISVNGFVAIVDNNGNFSYYYKLQNGDNAFIITATDPAGNQTEKKIKVTYNP